MFLRTCSNIISADNKIKRCWHFLCLSISLFFFGCAQDSVSYQDVESVASLDAYKNFSYSPELDKNEVLEKITAIEIYSSLPIKDDLITYSISSRKDTIIALQTFLNGNEILLNEQRDSLPYLSIQVSENSKGGFNLDYQHVYKSKVISDLQVDEKLLLFSKLAIDNKHVVYKRHARNGDFIEFGRYAIGDDLNKDTTVVVDHLSIFKAFYVDSIETMNKLEQ